MSTAHEHDTFKLVVVSAEFWDSYQHEFGSAAETEPSIDLDTDLMRLATGGSAA